MHYGIALLHIDNPAAYDRYRRRFAATLEGTGGRLPAADANPGVLEGEWSGNKVVLLDFPDVGSFGPIPGNRPRPACRQPRNRPFRSRNPLTEARP